MENTGQNNSNTAFGDKISDTSSVPNPNTNEAGFQSANLNKKKDELFFSGNIGDDVSSYLNQVGGKASQFVEENPARPPETKTILKQSIVRTLKSDTEEAIKLERISLANIMLAEQKKKQKYPQIEQFADSQKSKKGLFLALSLFFVFAGIGAFYFNILKEKIATVPEKAPEITALIPSDHTTEFNLNASNGKELSASLSKIIIETETKPNSIENIYIFKNITSSEKGKELKKAATSEEFLSLVAIKAPGALIRSLKSEYMLGVRSSDGNHPFIILKTKSYENAFAGMLAWEKSIGKDLEQLFSVSGEIANRFEDILVKNKDARALRNFDGKIILVYSIPDKETILIATDTETLAELFDRVIRSRMVR